MTVLAANRWKSNAELIADVAKLGYLDGWVYDCTYGQGTFWKLWRPEPPEEFTYSDLYTSCAVDFTDMPWADKTFDAVVFDPPYKLNGTPDPTVDTRYGVQSQATWQQRHALIRAGLWECCRVAKRYVLLKCQDQVCSGKVRWQTRIFADHAEGLGFEQVDRFDMLGHHRPQPMEGRTQKHAHGRPSTLLVFERQS